MCLLRVSEANALIKPDFAAWGERSERGKIGRAGITFKVLTIVSPRGTQNADRYQDGEVLEMGFFQICPVLVSVG